VLTKGAEGGPGDLMAIGCAEREMNVTTKSFKTVTELESWSIECGCGGFLLR
jgi:hypothetical protein